LREEGLKVGFVRPITLWPFPDEIMVEATRNARKVVVYELNTGQMFDDVRLAVRDREVEFIGAVSYDLDAFGVAPALTPLKVARRLREALGAIPREIA
jgi:2-oxoglutarate ferredoxin oxidoreductase subunit alpha